jgi:hypothetical protein
MVELADRVSAPDAYCARCARNLAGRGSHAAGDARRCLPCYLRFRPMLRTSIVTALLVGTALVAINQGAAIARDGLTGGIAWRAALTYLVPFCVATWGAVAGSRR